MGSIHLRIDDEFSKRKFRVEVTEGSPPAGLHPYFTHYKVSPFFSPREGEVAVSFLTCSEIIKMINDESEVRIIDQKDLLTVCEISSAYREAINRYKNRNEHIVTLIAHIDKALSVLNNTKRVVEHVRANAGIPLRIQQNTIADLIKQCRGDIT